MPDFALNENPSFTKLSIGRENIPLLIIDDFAKNPDALIACAGDGSAFKADKQNFYPGKRVLTPKIYERYTAIKVLPIPQENFNNPPLGVFSSLINKFLTKLIHSCW